MSLDLWRTHRPFDNKFQPRHIYSWRSNGEEKKRKKKKEKERKRKKKKEKEKKRKRG